MYSSPTFSDTSDDESRQKEDPAHKATDTSTSPNENPSSLNSFSPFSKLPAELRHEIWRLATMASTDLEGPGVCVLNRNNHWVYGDDHGRQAHELDDPTVKPASPAVLFASKESYDIVGRLVARRPFEPDRDVLFVPFHHFWSFYDRCTNKATLLPWILEVRHMALYANYHHHGSWFDDLIRHTLTSLETISVVFPQNTSPVYYGGDMEENSTPTLRRLTADELATIQVAPDRRARQRDVEAFMNKLAKQTNQRFWIRGEGQQHRSYDPETGFLLFKFHVCFFVEV